MNVTTLEIADRLADALNNASIDYCHWKSNFDLAEALAGETDLDLLVGRESLSHALTILMHLGFKPATVKWGLNTPSIYHYYGFEPQTGQLFHVHLFCRVLTGESYVKSHLFPFETMLLENTDTIGKIKVASKSAELVLFILRTYIKYSSLLDLIHLTRNRKHLEHLGKELRWLQTDSDISEASRLLKEYCPVMDESLFIKCVATLNGDTSLTERLILARRVRQHLRVYAKYSALKRSLSYGHLLCAQMWRRLTGNKKNKMLRAGGVVIAFVGPEATGKSTLVADCASWLGGVFAVRTVHAGKPPSSWLTLPIHRLIPMMRRLLPRLRTTRQEARGTSVYKGQSKAKVGGMASLIYAVRSVTLAWDRRRLLLKTRRAAANGEIAICDRYPSLVVGAMDSRRLEEEPTNKGLVIAIYNWLTYVEKRLYQQIPPPDIVLRLTVSIDTAKKRNRERIKAGNETDAYVESRHRQCRGWYMTGVKHVHDIDTERPLRETILSVREMIWEAL